MATNQASLGWTDDRFLDGEDPDTSDLELATRWMEVYADLLRLSASLEAAHPAEASALRRPADLYRRRMRFWKDRCLAIRREGGGSSTSATNLPSRGRGSD